MEIGRTHIVLVDGDGKKDNQLKGRTDTYRTVVFDNREVGMRDGSEGLRKVKKGDYVMATVKDCTSGTLHCDLVSRVTFKDFFEFSNNRPFVTNL